VGGTEGGKDVHRRAGVWDLFRTEVIADRPLSFLFPPPSSTPPSLSTSPLKLFSPLAMTSASIGGLLVSCSLNL